MPERMMVMAVSSGMDERVGCLLQVAVHVPFLFENLFAVPESDFRLLLSVFMVLAECPVPLDVFSFRALVSVWLPGDGGDQHLVTEDSLVTFFPIPVESGEFSVWLPSNIIPFKLFLTVIIPPGLQPLLFAIPVYGFLFLKVLQFPFCHPREGVHLSGKVSNPVSRLELFPLKDSFTPFLEGPNLSLQYFQFSR